MLTPREAAKQATAATYQKDQTNFAIELVKRRLEVVKRSPLYYQSLLSSESPVPFFTEFFGPVFTPIKLNNHWQVDLGLVEGSEALKINLPMAGKIDPEDWSYAEDLTELHILRKHVVDHLAFLNLLH